MTCVVGLIDKNTIYMGADSAIVEVDACREVVSPEAKVYKKSCFLIGDSGNLNIGQIIRYNLKLPRYTKNMNIYEYMTAKFNKALRDVLREFGQLYCEQETNLESMEGTFLIGVKTSDGPKLFELDENFAILEICADYAAVGCGADFSFGAMAAMEKTKLKPEEKILIALEASERFSAFVRRPFVIESI